MGHLGQAYGIRLGISRFWPCKKISRAFSINQYFFNLFHLYTRRLFRYRFWTHYGIIFNKAFCFVEENKVNIVIFLYDLALNRAAKRVYLKQRKQKKNFVRVNLFRRYKLKHYRKLSKIRRKFRWMSVLGFRHKLRFSFLTKYAKIVRNDINIFDKNLRYSLPLPRTGSTSLTKLRPWLRRFYNLKFFKPTFFRHKLLKSFMKKLFKKLIKHRNYPDGHRNRVNQFLEGKITSSSLDETPTFDVKPVKLRNFFRLKLLRKPFTRLKHHQIRKLRGFRYIQRILFQTFRAPMYKHLWRVVTKAVFSNRLFKRNMSSQVQVQVFNTPAYKLSAFALTTFALRRLAYEDKINAIFKPLLRKLRKMVKGIRILCCGRFTRRQRASRMLFSFGKINQSKLSVPVDFQFSSIALKYGVGSIKIWIVKK